MNVKMNCPKCGPEKGELSGDSLICHRCCIPFHRIGDTNCFAVMRMAYIYTEKTQLQHDDTDAQIVLNKVLRERAREIGKLQEDIVYLIGEIAKLWDAIKRKENDAKTG